MSYLSSSPLEFTVFLIDRLHGGRLLLRKMELGVITYRCAWSGWCFGLDLDHVVLHLTEL